MGRLPAFKVGGRLVYCKREREQKVQRLIWAHHVPVFSFGGSKIWMLQTVIAGLAGEALDDNSAGTRRRPLSRSISLIELIRRMPMTRPNERVLACMSDERRFGSILIDLLSLGICSSSSSV